MSVHRFTTELEARRYIEAVGRSHIYTSTGPPLPRCDSPHWLPVAARVGRGKLATCSCPSRAEPLPECVWATWRHSDVVELDGAYVVEADKRESSTAGEVVDLGDGGTEVVLSRVPTAALASADRERSRPTWPVRENDADFAKRLAKGVVRDVRTR